LFAIEFARQGATTVGLEIRDTHLAKAEFARRALGLETCRFVQGDVRAIPADLGRFDIVLCAGILYHLDFPDNIRFLRAIAGRGDDLVIIDSHFAYEDISVSVLPISAMRPYKFEGRTYRGRAIVEHERHTSKEHKAKKSLWTSIDNETSVWLEERDVITIMEEAGFRLAFRDYPGPSYRDKVPDRPTLVFKRGK
jgi:ubiquinone/menaquinone biosynthesis C-methylase UbiE